MNKSKKGFRTLANYTLMLLFLFGGAVMGLAFALSSFYLTVSGKVTFTVYGVDAIVTGSVTGAQSNPVLETLTFNEDTTDSTISPESWNNLKFEFNASVTPIVFTIGIENRSESLNIFSNIYMSAPDQVTVTEKVAGNEVEVNSDFIVDASSSKQAQYIFNVTDTTSAFLSKGFELEIFLNKADPDDESNYSPYLAFTDFNNTTLTCSVLHGTDTTATSITIPSRVSHEGKTYDVVAIADNGFENMTTLTSITLPNSIKTIGDYAFAGGGLTSITIPKNVTEIGSMAFASCPLSSTSVASGNSVYTEYSYGIYKGTELVVGSSYLYQSIMAGTTTIGEGAYYGRATLPKITIPSSVKYINENAFYGCTSLETITIPSSVTRIDKNAFSGSGLTSVTFENTSGWAIEDGNTLSSSDLANTTTAKTYLTSTYSDCVWIGGLTLDASEYSTLLFAYDSSTMTASVAANSSNKPTGSLVIPEKVLHDGVEYSVTSIAAMGFTDCTSLTSITIPSSLTTINVPSMVPVHPFGGCTSLTSIIVDENNPTYYSYGNGLYEGSELIAGCKNTTTIKDGTTSIRQLAFYQDTGLTSITIPSSVTYIGHQAFNDCTSLTSAVFENPVGWEKFSYTFSPSDLADPSTAADKLSNMTDAWTCTGENYSYPTLIFTYYWESRTASVSANYSNLPKDDTTIPSTISWDGVSFSVTEIDCNGFSGCTGLTSITIPSTVEKIGANAFSGCKGLTSITLGSTTNWLAGDTAIDSSDLDDTANAVTLLTSTYVDREWTKATVLDASAYTTLTFTYNTSSKTATVAQNSSNKPTGSLKIPAKVLYNSVEYTVTEIAVRGFMMGSMSEVILPDTIETIRDCAFMSCTSITSIKLGSGLKKIGNMAFAWMYIEQLDLPDGLETIADYGLAYLSKLKSIRFPDSVTYIGSNVCSNMGSSSLEECILPSGIKYIPDGMFSGMTMYEMPLKSITIPSSVERIGNNAFNMCTNLTNIHIPSSVKYIGEDAFYGCKMSSIIIPENVIKIGAGAFSKATTTNIIFKNTSGWSAISTSDSSEVALDVTASSLNATNLAGSGTYASGYDIVNEKYAKAENYSDILTFSYSGTSATVTGLATTTVSAIEIPESIVYNGTTYTVTSIGSSAFENNTSIRYVSIPKTITSIGDSAFYGCTNLSAFKNSNTSIQTIGQSAFYNTSIGSFSFDSTLTSIGFGAFQNCKNLGSASLSSTKITTIEMNTFSGCTSLSSASLPDTLTEMEFVCFANTSLTSITIPKNVKRVLWAFSDCSYLTSVTFSYTTGWTIANYTQTLTTDVTNPTTNAEYLRAGANATR